MNRNEYRPDIDGLRSVAVLSVLFHHLNASLLPGGFVGVDVFFVISGFLITSHVYKDVRSGTFSLKQFYKRRINRIIPALTTVVLASLLVGFIVLSPSDLVLLVKGAVFSVLGVSNIFFWREYGSYFSGNAAEAPLLNTWSLGVEEQFYVVWPIFFMLAIRFLRYGYAFWMVVALTILALVVSETLVGMAKSASYYLLPSRIFELMIGCMLALVMAHFQPSSRKLSSAIFAGGFILLGGSILLIDESSPFPGINGLWPCLAAALIIWSGKGTPFSNILANRPAVFLGLLSYSVYLWHWPIIAYLNYLGVEINILVGSLVIISSVVLAYFTWKFIECPARRKGTLMSFHKVFLLRFSFPLLILTAITALTLYTDGFATRFDPKVAEFGKLLEARPDVLRNGCHVPNILYDTPPSERCRIGASKQDLDGVLIGDSFANHFTGMIDVMAKSEGLALMDYTMDGCPPILGYDTGAARSYAKRCLKRNETVYEMIAEERFAKVILAASWPKSAEAGERLASSIAAILRSNASLTVVLSSPSIEGASTCPIRRIMYDPTRSCGQPKSGHPDYFAKIKAAYPAINFVDPTHFICSNGTCNPVHKGILLYRDSDHLNDVGSRYLGERMTESGITLAKPVDVGERGP